MKTPALIALALSASPFALAEVGPGDSLDEVRDALGRPAGQAQVGGRHLLYYAQGSVELVNDRVTRVALRTPEEQAGHEAREARRRTEREERRAAAVAEGTALRDGKLADAAFLAESFAYQVAFWEDFARRYPDVPCAKALVLARVKLGEQLQEKARQREEPRRVVEPETRFAMVAMVAPSRRVRYHREHRDCHHEFALWPVSYTYYDAPLPAYTTPTTPGVDAIPSGPARRVDPERRPTGRDGAGDRGREHRGGWRDAGQPRDPRGDPM